MKLGQLIAPLVLTAIFGAALVGTQIAKAQRAEAPDQQSRIVGE